MPVRSSPETWWRQRARARQEEMGSRFTLDLVGHGEGGGCYCVRQAGPSNVTGKLNIHKIREKREMNPSRPGTHLNTMKSPVRSRH